MCTVVKQNSTHTIVAATKVKGKKKENSWSNKAKLRSKEIKLLRMKNKRLQKNRDKWRAQCRSFQKQKGGEKVKGHPYSLELMFLGVLLHVTYNISLRGAAKALCAVSLLYGRTIKQVSATTIRNWSLRLGLYFLTRPIKKGRYALIADESIAMGQEKLLVLLVVELDGSMSRTAPLQMSDMEILHLQSGRSWKGDDISSIIREKAQEQGIEIAYAISDKGSNLRNAFNKSGINWIGDCTHMLANNTQKLFQNDGELNGLIKNMNGTRAKWALSHLAAYAPPALRKKARFHQTFVIYSWAELVLDKWEMLPFQVKEELAYLDNCRKLVQTMKHIHTFIEVFSAIVKGKGITSQTKEMWGQAYEAQCRPLLAEQVEPDQRVQKYVNAIEGYIAGAETMLANESQILCCSDIIESMFGKYKNKGGCQMITDDILNIASYTHSIQKQDVKNTMDTIKTNSTKEWKQQNTTESLLAQKRKLFAKMAA
jgi:hypothetical protein